MNCTAHSLAKLTLLALATTLLVACANPAVNDSLTSTAQHSSIHVEGVPGEVRTTLEKITAVVTAIDYKTRSVTLKDAQGQQRSLQAGPKVRHFERIKVGDLVQANAAEETLIFLPDQGAAADDGIIERLLNSAKGDQPGLVVSSSEQSTVMVKAVDLSAHTATLQYPDGRSKIVAVRPDVPLTAASVGRLVVIRVTTAMVISVAKP